MNAHEIFATQRYVRSQTCLEVDKLYTKLLAILKKPPTQ